MAKMNKKTTLSAKKSATTGATKKTTTPQGTQVVPAQNTPATPMGGLSGFQMPQEPAGISSQQPQMPPPAAHPIVPMSPGMIAAIRKSPTGKIPPGLIKWMQAHGKGVK